LYLLGLSEYPDKFNIENPKTEKEAVDCADKIDITTLDER